jgi:hypothetical protein
MLQGGYIRSMNPTLHRTSEAATLLNVSASTLRKWHAEGLVSPSASTAGGHARWTDQDVQGLRERLAASGGVLMRTGSSAVASPVAEKAPADVAATISKPASSGDGGLVVLAAFCIVIGLFGFGVSLGLKHPDALNLSGADPSTIIESVKVRKADHVTLAVGGVPKFSREGKSVYAGVWDEVEPAEIDLYRRGKKPGECYDRTIADVSTRICVISSRAVEMDVVSAGERFERGRKTESTGGDRS